MKTQTPAQTEQTLHTKTRTAQAQDVATFVDNRPEAVAQRGLQEMMGNSPQAMQHKARMAMMDHSPQAMQHRARMAMMNDSPLMVAQRNRADALLDATAPSKQTVRQLQPPDWYSEKEKAPPKAIQTTVLDMGAFLIKVMANDAAAEIRTVGVGPCVAVGLRYVGENASIYALSHFSSESVVLPSIQVMSEIFLKRAHEIDPSVDVGNIEVFVAGGGGPDNLWLRVMAALGARGLNVAGGNVLHTLDEGINDIDVTIGPGGFHAFTQGAKAHDTQAERTGKLEELCGPGRGFLEAIEREMRDGAIGEIEKTIALANKIIQENEAGMGELLAPLLPLLIDGLELARAAHDPVNGTNYKGWLKNCTDLEQEIKAAPPSLARKLKITLKDLEAKEAQSRQADVNRRLNGIAKIMSGIRPVMYSLAERVQSR